MDLTDINPTIISTDTEDEDHAEGACHKLKRKLSFKNPVVRNMTFHGRLGLRRLRRYCQEHDSLIGPSGQ